MIDGWYDSPAFRFAVSKLNLFFALIHSELGAQLYCSFHIFDSQPDMFLLLLWARMFECLDWCWSFFAINRLLTDPTDMMWKNEMKKSIVFRHELFVCASLQTCSGSTSSKHRSDYHWSVRRTLSRMLSKLSDRIPLPVPGPVHDALVIHLCHLGSRQFFFFENHRAISHHLPRSVNQTKRMMIDFS